MITFATIGTSQITHQFADAVRAVPGVEVGCVFSRDARRAASFAGELGVERSSDDLDAMLADPGIDAVYVASPNSVHGAQVRQAIEAGKHVLVEKPAVTSAAEWDDLTARARQQRVILLEAIRTQYDPGLAAVRDLLPRLGQPRRVSFRYEKRSDRYDRLLAGEQVNIFDPALGGGALRDLGVYCLHALVGLFGPPLASHAAVVAVSSGADGLGTILAEYPGFLADLHFSKITTAGQPSLIQAEAGTLAIDDIAAPRQLRLQLIGAEAEDVTVTGPSNVLDGEVRRFVELATTGGDPSLDQARTGQVLAQVDGALGQLVHR